MRSAGAIGTIASVAIVAVLGGCTADDEPSSGGSAVPDIMVEEAKQYIDDNGLFRMPEGKTIGSVETTALFASTIPPNLLPKFMDLDAAARSAFPTSTDIVGLWSYSVLAQQKPNPAESHQLAELWKSQDRVKPSPEAGEEVAYLATYAQAYANFRRLGIEVDAQGDVLKRMNAVDTDVIASAPYLAWKMSKASRDLGLPATPELTSSATSFEIDSDLSSLRDISDTFAVLAARGKEGVNSETLSELRQSAATMLARLDEEEEAERVGLVALLAVTGEEAEARKYVHGQYQSRIDTASGLIRAASQTEGTVEATYLFARLLDERFSSIASQSTRDSLNAAANTKTAPLTLRLMASAALKRSGDGRWKAHASVATQAVDSLPRSITQKDLANYLSVANPASEVMNHFPASSLVPFEPPAGDEAAEREAIAALNHGYLFANEGAVRSMFPGVRQSLKEWGSSQLRV